MTIEYFKKNVYGIETYYLVECEKAQTILDILNQKTITKVQMGMFEDLGITFKQVLN